MKVDILDPNVFRAINPEDIERLLINLGWVETLTLEENTIGVWDKHHLKDRNYRLIVPKDRVYVDYEESVAKVLKTIAEIYDRSQIHVLEELNTQAIGDILRIHGYDPYNPHSSTIQYRRGLRLIHIGYTSLTAGAAAAVEKVPVHSSSKKKEIQSYLQQIRLGQTEQGSYLVKLISPIEKPLSTEQLRFPLPEFDPPIPFERRAMSNLLKGLQAIEQITTKVIEGKERFSLELYEEAVQDGVSANLCEAITAENFDLKDDLPQVRIELDIDWSYAIRDDIPSNSTAVFSPEMFPYISNAARLFRESHPEQIELHGFIVGLSRKKKKDPGTVYLLAEVHSQYRNIRIELSASDYNTAIHAHQEAIPIQCAGNLIKTGNRYTLEQILYFSLRSRDTF